MGDWLRGKTPLVIDPNYKQAVTTGGGSGGSQTVTVTETPSTVVNTTTDTPTVNPFFKELPKEKLTVSQKEEPKPQQPAPGNTIPDFIEVQTDDGFDHESVAPTDVSDTSSLSTKTPNLGNGLWRTRANVGNWTGAIRPHYPRIRRPFGTNPREAFLGKRYTGMYQTGFDASVVESKATPSFIPSQRTMVQDGAPSITAYIPALRSGGSEHVFIGVNHQRR